MKRRGESIADYFARVVMLQPNGCWLFPQLDRRNGYAVLHVRDGGSRNILMHRWSYEHFRGPIPNGRTIDHLCHTNDPSCPGGVRCPHRQCVNPQHLEPVSTAENVLRGHGPCAVNKRKTHCNRGHEFTPDNTYSSPGRPGRRSCLTCKRENQRRWRARQIERTTA